MNESIHPEEEGGRGGGGGEEEEEEEEEGRTFFRNVETPCKNTKEDQSRITNDGSTGHAHFLSDQAICWFLLIRPPLVLLLLIYEPSAVGR
jgi:hypothetical protein